MCIGFDLNRLAEYFAPVFIADSASLKLVGAHLPPVNLNRFERSSLMHYRVRIVIQSLEARLFLPPPATYRP
jgi:hypothetical protein